MAKLANPYNLASRREPVSNIDKVRIEYAVSGGILFAAIRMAKLAHYNLGFTTLTDGNSDKAIAHGAMFIFAAAGRSHRVPAHRFV